MYAYLRGTVGMTGENTIVVDCGGVGYEVLTTKTAAAKSKAGDEVTIYTYLAVREDDMTLYGFPSMEEKAMFRQLTGISGIGPKAGLAILSEMSVSDVASAAISGDAKAFSRVSGIGKKTADRIVLELKDKMDVKMAVSAEGSAAADRPQERGAAQDAVDGLIGLGYTKAEAVAAVNTVKELADTPEDIMILALKRIGM